VRRRRNRVVTIVGAAAAAALIAMSAAVGGATPRSAALPRLAVPRGVSFATPPAQHLAPVRAGFIQEQLGLIPSAPPTSPAAPASRAVVDLAKQYQCVNGHQTDDPLSPPCNVAPGTANAGPTYQGVTSDEIRVAVVAFGNNTYACGVGPDNACTGQNRTAPTDAWFDLDKPQNRDLMFARSMTDYGKYFNARFQTFGRRVHFYLYFFDGNTYYEVQESQAHAKRVIEAIHPFAVILQTPQFSDHLAAELARRGVPTFTDLWIPPEPAAYYSKYPNRLWGYWPTIEQSADVYSSYVCTKVAPNPVAMSGIAGQNGQSRKIAMIHGFFQDETIFRDVATEVRKRLTACGVALADEGEYVIGNGCHAGDYRHLPVSDLQIMARFKAAGVTTILWPACLSGTIAAAAYYLNYHPEWIVLGDYQFDANGPVSDASLTTLFDHHAIVVTPATYEPPLRAKRCYQALHDVDRGITDFDAFWACRSYNQFRQLFSAIQQAGPSLGPASMGRGLHALPPVASADPLTPSCSYADGGATCVKDAMAMYWDAAAPTTYNSVSPTGCWRVLEGGRRYLPGAWPAGNINTAMRGNEPCNDHDNDSGGTYLLPDRYHVTAGLPLLPQTLP
jgi:hypothetical protein